ncbi:MAG: TerB family tellurite resistance protein [Spirochaetota bacterium]
MFNFFRDKENVKRVEEQDAKTQEALIEGLLLVMYADSQIKQDEKDELEKILDSVTWQKDLRYIGKYGEVIAYTRDALTNNTKFENIITAIKSLPAEKKKFVIDSCEKMALADGKYDEKEKEIIQKMQR